jgi:hypothetical protein
MAVSLHALATAGAQMLLSADWTSEPLGLLDAANALVAVLMAFVHGVRVVPASRRPRYDEHDSEMPDGTSPEAA